MDVDIEIPVVLDAFYEFIHNDELIFGEKSCEEAAREVVEKKIKSYKEARILGNALSSKEVIQKRILELINENKRLII